MSHSLIIIDLQQEKEQIVLPSFSQNLFENLPHVKLLIHSQGAGQVLVHQVMEQVQSNCWNVTQSTSLQTLWFHIGYNLSEAQSPGVYNIKKCQHVIIFTDSPERFAELRERVKLFPIRQLSEFNLSNALSGWSNFQNHGEMLSSFESKQIMIIFKKFVKSMMTSKPITSLDKLISLCQNLVKSHLNTLHHHREKVQVDLTFHLIKHLFLENIVDQPLVLSAILNNCVDSIQDFEKMSKMTFTDKFQETINKFKEQLQKKQDQIHKDQSKAISSSFKREDAENTGGERQEEPVNEIAKVMQETVQLLFSQYAELFEKAKIYQIKKMGKLQKQIANYTSGHLKKQGNSQKLQLILGANQDLICANLLNILAKREMIYFTEKTATAAPSISGSALIRTADQIEHCSAQEVALQNQTPVSLQEIILPHVVAKIGKTSMDSLEWAKALLEDPLKFLYKERKPHVLEPGAKGGFGQKNARGPNALAAPVSDVDKVIKKFTTFMQKTKLEPRNMQDLERQVKKSVKFANVQMPAAGDPSHTPNSKKGIVHESEAAYIDFLTQQAIKQMGADGLINMQAFNKG